MKTVSVYYSRAAADRLFARLVEVLKVTIASRTVIKWALSEKVGLVPENG